MKWIAVMIGLWGLLVVGLTGCMRPVQGVDQSTTTPVSINTPVPATEKADDWEVLAPGLERRTIQPLAESRLADMVALRIDPARFTFRAHYQPADPLTLPEWRLMLPEAIAFVNTNFFDPQNQILGLLVSDGQVYGQSYTDRGGMFSVREGSVRIQSLIEEPYQGETLEQAVQAFPMLVLNGEAAFTQPINDRPTRRTVIALDSAGRVLLLATPILGLELVDLSTFLAESAVLDVQMAFNLDGGGSTLMHVTVNGEPEPEVVSLDPVPAVLAVYRPADASG
jgi:hypothetical protein